MKHSWNANDSELGSDSKNHIIRNKNALDADEKSKLSREFPENLPGSEYKMELVWRNIIIFIILHIGFIIGIFVEKKWMTIVFTILYGSAGGFGTTAGAHRLWAHKSYKTNTALKLLLLYFQTISIQNSVFEWARDHRVHHKYTDTNADPHNARRGFFFSHMGWLLCKKHPDVIKYGKKISMSDLEADPHIMFQHKHFLPLMLIASVIIPVFIPWYFWNESFVASFFYAGTFRYILSLHVTWLINSAAHVYGMKPFDKNISPADSYLIGFLAMGEGWHNYHHVFPYDYKTSELGFYLFNFTTAFIDFFAWLGMAYELKTVSADLIQRRVMRTGDGSHKFSNENNLEEQIKTYILSSAVDINGNLTHKNEDTIWGYDDEMLDSEEKKFIKIMKVEN